MLSMFQTSIDLFDKTTNIVIFGKNGQVGKALQSYFKQYHKEAVFLGRDDCDLSNQAALIETLNEYKPKIIINASAYTDVERAQSEPDMALVINRDAVGLMAEYIAKTSNGILVHFSTNFVYSGFKQDRYLESDIPVPASVYGQSKLAGEIMIVEAFNKAMPDKKLLSRYYILRTSWVYGEGNNFIRTILRLAEDNEFLRVVSDQCGVPTSADWLASLAIKLVESKIDSGIYHAVPDGQTSWHGLAKFVINRARELGERIQVNSDCILPINSLEYPSIAPRPKNSLMNNNQLKRLLLKMGHTYQHPSWQEQVSQYVQNFVQDFSKK